MSAAPLEGDLGNGDPTTGDAGSELALLLSELVAFPTESRSPNVELIHWFADHVESNGGRVTVLEGEEGRANLLASFGPQRAGGVMLSGHTDVVPAGPGWATDPYSMTKIGDSLYGRGTADMKGFIAATVRTTAQFRGMELTRPLHLALSFDEEIGCIGVRHALREIVQRDLRPDIVIIGEPTMMRPRHSHMGKLAYEIVCNAAPAHSSLSHSSPSAIASAARLINVIEGLQRQYRPTGEPEVTFNCGTIAGGTALNVIAQRCAFVFESRHTVDHDPDVVLRPFMDAVDGERETLATVGGSVEVTEITRYPALCTSPDDAWLHAVERIADAGPATSIGFGTEGGLFAEALDASVVICGPGDIAVAHRPDEYVTVDQLLRCERFLCGVVQQMCVDPVAEK